MRSWGLLNLADWPLQRPCSAPLRPTLLRAPDSVDYSPDPLLLQDVQPLCSLDDLKDDLQLSGTQTLAPPLPLCLVRVHRPARLQPWERIVWLERRLPTTAVTQCAHQALMRVL